MWQLYSFEEAKVGTLIYLSVDLYNALFADYDSFHMVRLTKESNHVFIPLLLLPFPLL